MLLISRPSMSSESVLLKHLPNEYISHSFGVVRCT